jgi:hypothetical protein
MHTVFDTSRGTFQLLFDNMVPGMKSSFLTHLKQDDASCPDGGVDPLYA